MSGGNKVVVYLDTTREEILRTRFDSPFTQVLKDALGNTKTYRVFISRVGGWHWEDLPPVEED